jgi:hypothetical protein
MVSLLRLFVACGRVLGDDIPHALKDGNASLLEFPLDWTLDDFPHYAYNRDLGYRILSGGAFIIGLGHRGDPRPVRFIGHLGQPIFAQSRNTSVVHRDSPFSH